MIDQCPGWLTHTLSKPSSMATLAHSLAYPDRVFLFFCHHKVIMEKMIWPHKTIPRWTIFIMSHLVVHHHGLTSRRFFAEKYFCNSILDAYYLLSFGVAWPRWPGISVVWCTHVFPHFASFSVSLHLVWQPDSLINMDGTILL